MTTDNSEHLYRRLADGLREDIVAGRLLPGDRLPSMREFAVTNEVSLGTVRHVYNLLQQAGLVETDRGRGTFVCGALSEQDKESRKERALDAIDTMLDELSRSGFSSREAQIFLELRLRQREEMTRPVRIVTVANSPEERSILERSLETLRLAERYRMTLDDLVTDPERLSYGPDFIVYPQSIEQDIRDLNLQDIGHLPASIRMSPSVVAELARLDARDTIGVLSFSLSFMSVLRRRLSMICGEGLKYDILKLGDVEATASFIGDKEIIILPPDYLNLIDSAEADVIRAAAKKGQRQIRTEFTCDEGTLIYIGRAVRRRYDELRESM